MASYWTFGPCRTEDVGASQRGGGEGLIAVTPGVSAAAATSTTAAASLRVLVPLLGKIA
jgi:hypothetical protein